MSKRAPVSKPTYSLLPTDVEGFDSLAELALDMHWYWNHSVDEVWRQRAQVPSIRPAADYTARVIPYYEGVSVPLEEAHILWQR